MKKETPQRILPPIRSDNFLLTISKSADEIARFLELSINAGELSRSDWLLLIGSDPVTRDCHEKLSNADRQERSIRTISLADPQLNSSITSSKIAIICEAPNSDAGWSKIQEILYTFPEKVETLWHRIRDFLIFRAITRETEYTGDVAKVWSAYKLDGFTDPVVDPIREYNSAIPFHGKDILELGPMDGFQTAALLRQGVKSVSCVEIRPENYLKLLAAKELNGWKNVHLIFENLHCLHPGIHGTFDAVLAHGVYYHSDCPFTLLENITRLSPIILFGGFCATDDSPPEDWSLLENDRREYRVKHYLEYEFFTNGVTTHGYYFHADDLLKWFERSGFEIQIISHGDSGMPHIAGQYIRFVATKRKSFATNGQDPGSNE